MYKGPKAKGKIGIDQRERLDRRINRGAQETTCKSLEFEQFTGGTKSHKIPYLDILITNNYTLCELNFRSMHAIN